MALGSFALSLHLASRPAAAQSDWPGYPCNADMGSHCPTCLQTMNSYKCATTAPPAGYKWGDCGQTPQMGANCFYRAVYCGGVAYAIDCQNPNNAVNGDGCGNSFGACFSY